MKLAIILFIALCGGICLYGVLKLIDVQKSISTLESRMDTSVEIMKSISNSENHTNADSLISKIRDIQFQQDYYTKQLDIQSNWFILYVTVLFGAFAVFGFVVSRQTIADASANYKEAIAVHEQIHRSHEFELLKLKDLMLLTNASLTSMSSSINEEFKLIVFVHSLMAAKYRSMVSEPRITPEIQNSIIGNIKDVIDSLSGISEEDLIQIKTDDFPDILNDIHNISKIKNDEIKLLCASLLTKLPKSISSGVN